MTGLRAVVVIPARDEEERIGRCLRALARRRCRVRSPSSSCWTAARTRRATVARAARHDGRPRPARVVARARAPASAPRGATAWTSPARGSRGRSGRADRLHRRRHEVAPRLAGRAARARRRRGRRRRRPHRAATPSRPPRCPPTRCAAASGARACAWPRSAPRTPRPSTTSSPARRMAVTARAYRAVGGLDAARRARGRGARAAPRRRGPADRALRRRARPHVGPHRRPRAARPGPRPRSSAAGWRGAATTAVPYTLDGLLAAQGRAPPSRSCCPARDCAATIAGVLDTTVMPLRRRGAGRRGAGRRRPLDRRDGRPRAARPAPASCAQDDAAARARAGAGQGRRDVARRCRATTGDVVAFLDADTADPDPVHLLGLLGPLLDDPAVALRQGRVRPAVPRRRQHPRPTRAAA